MPRFSANLSFLFKEAPFAERFRRAASSGFRGVEFFWPGVEQVDAVTRAVADTGLEVRCSTSTRAIWPPATAGWRPTPTG